MFNDENIHNLLNKEDGWQKFIDNYSDLIYTIIARRRYSEETTANIYWYVVEELNKNNLKRLKSFKGLSKFSTWLTTVINHLISDYFRRRKYIPTVSIDDEEKKILLPDYNTDLEKEFFKKQVKEKKKLTRQMLENIIKKLSVEEQLLIKYRFEHNLKLEEIAKLMNLKLNETYQKIKKILKYLKEEMIKQGFNENDYKSIKEVIGED